jgi:high-affinity Fe2+/Pb2+ permease
MGGINHVAVWLAGIVHFMLGAGWYTAFGPAWMAGVGKTEAQIKADQPNMAIPMVIAVVVAIVIAYTLAWLLPKLGAQSAGGGARSGATLALALIASTMAMNYGFEARSPSLWLINAGYMVAGMAVMGAIIGGWRKKA